jgi:peptidyl-prolyl cis-trans isomerase C
MSSARDGQLTPQGPDYEEAMKEEALDRLITAEVLSQKAAEEGFKADPQEVEQTMTEMEQRMGGREGLEKALNERGLTYDLYKRDVGKSIEIEKLLKQEVYDKVALQPNEVREYYNANSDQFKAPERVKARHILIQAPEDATEAQKQEAMAAIKSAADRIRNGEAFEEVAREVSQDGSATNGGDLGYFGRGRMVPEFEKVAFSLEKGQVSDVVETQFGYHLIMVEDKQPEGVMPFEEIEPKLAEYLKLKKTESIGQEYVDKLKAEAQIEKIPF